MVNLRASFEEEASLRGDILRYAVVGWHENDEKRFEAYRREWPVQAWTVASKTLDYEYDSGFGGADCHAVVAWGDLCVYFVHEYDGATSIASVPRSPTACAPSWGSTEIADAPAT